MLHRKKKKMHPIDCVDKRDALDWIWVESDLLSLVDLYKLSSLIQDDKLISYFLQFTDFCYRTLKHSSDKCVTHTDLSICDQFFCVSYCLLHRPVRLTCITRTKPFGQGCFELNSFTQFAYLPHEKSYFYLCILHQKFSFKQYRSCRRCFSLESLS